MEGTIQLQAPSRSDFLGRRSARQLNARERSQMLDSFLNRKIRIATTFIVSILALGLSGEQALAHGDYPSAHRAIASCYTTGTTGTWTVTSTPYMNRADGFLTGVYVGAGGSTYDPQTGAITGGSSTLIDGHTQQWLYYQVVVGTQLASGAWHWDYGNWMRRKEQLGGHTDGLSTEVQLPDGTWARTDYSMVGDVVDYYNGSVWVSYPTDASIVTRGSAAGWKYVYGHMYWGTIYNIVSRKHVFGPYDHMEPLGYVNCA
jgi:hypothetical protein